MTGRRASLSAQIAEVRREIEQRRRVYARQVSVRKMRQVEADLLIANMEAVLDTLVWLQRHEQVVRAAVEAARVSNSNDRSAS